jgi:hypothetical protein
MIEPGFEGAKPYSGDRHIPKPQRRVERVISLLIAGIAFLNFPILSVFSKIELVFGIPVLYFYLFLVWGLIIGAMALILHDRPQKSSASPAEKEPEER